MGDNFPLKIVVGVKIYIFVKKKKISPSKKNIPHFKHRRLSNDGTRTIGTTFKFFYVILLIYIQNIVIQVKTVSKKLKITH